MNTICSGLSLHVGILSFKVNETVCSMAELNVSIYARTLTTISEASYTLSEYHVSSFITELTLMIVFTVEKLISYRISSVVQS